MNRQQKTQSNKIRRKSCCYISAVLGFVLAFCLTFAICQRLVTPKYASGITEGAFIREYYEEPCFDHDVIFLGDCEVYSSFVPAVLYRDFGINSYVRGSAQQYIFQSYYVLRDTLYYETPKVVVLSVASLKYDKAQNEAYNRETIDGMRWSRAKVDCIRASMTEGESFLSYVFPLLRFHSRITSLSRDDFTWFWRNRMVTFSGYNMHCESSKTAEKRPVRPLADYRFKDRIMHDLEEIRILCESRGIRLILIKAPDSYPYWYPEYDEQVQIYAHTHNIPYLNFQKLAPLAGIDMQTETYDGGAHLNNAGAEKMSRYLGQYLRNTIGLADRRGEKDLAAEWKSKLAAYDAEKKRQQKEILP